MLLFKVSFEDGHAEEFPANHCQVGAAGSLILSTFVMVPLGPKINPESGVLGPAFSQETRLVAVLPPPRAGLPAASWVRVETIERPDVDPGNGAADATIGEEVLH